MRKDFLLFLSFLVDAGYIVSFRVTKDKIFIILFLPDMAGKRTWRNRGNKRLIPIFRASKGRESRGGENGAKVRPSENILSSSSLKNAALVSQKN